MIAFVLCIIAAIAGIVFLCWDEKGFGVGAFLASVVLFFVSIFSSVPTGYTGILTTFGRVEDTTFEAGFHVKAPWQEVVTMDNREQKVSYEFESFSKDIQETQIKMSVNLMINKATAMNLYKEVGTEYQSVLVAPRVYEVTKNCFSKQAAEELISKRDVLSNVILEDLQEELKEYGINVVAVSIEDIDFTDAFTNAVEAKQVATQNKLRAQTEEEQKTMEATKKAERDKIEASAKAEVARIEADAQAYAVKVSSEAQAEANKKISESLTGDLISYTYATNWDGKMPETMIGESPVVPTIPIE